MKLEKLLQLKYKLVLNYVGIILLVLALILCLPLIMLIFYHQEKDQALYFIIPALFSAAIGGVLWKKNKEAGQDISLSIQEGGIIVVIAWMLTCILSALPFVLSGMLTITQGVFEAVSGWTTTGLSVVDVSKTNHIFLFWRSIMQLFGGAGLAIIMLAAIIGPSGQGLYSAEGRSDLLLPNIIKSTRLIMNIYLGYILAGIALYTTFGMPLFDAVNHSIAALSTGGFSTLSGSIGDYDNLSIELITIVLMIAGTVNFAAHYVLLKGQVKKFFQIGETKLLFLLLSISIPLVAFFSLKELYGSASKSIRIATFELVSALSTTGFSTVSYTNWNDFGIFIMILLMLIGGGTGSTAGGIKQYRVYVLLKSLVEDIKGFVKPKKRIREIGVERPEAKVYLSSPQLMEITHFVVLYLLVYALGVMVLTIHGYPLKESMFEFASSLSTVGLSVGITSPDTPSVVLWTQSIGMFLGRLEIVIFLYSITKIVKDMKAIRKIRSRKSS